VIAFSPTRKDEVPEEVATLLAADRARQLMANAPGWLIIGLSKNFRGLKILPRVAMLPTGPPPPSPIAWPEESELQRKVVDPAAAAEVVRRLLAPGEDHAAHFFRYLQLLRADTPEDPAWKEAFGASFTAVLEELEDSGVGTTDLRLELPAPELLSPQPLSYPQLLVMLGDLLTRVSPWNTVAADLHFETALEQVPDLAAALRGIGIVRDLDHRRLDAAAAFDLSLAANAQDPETLFLSAWGLIEGFRGSVGTLHAWEEHTPDPILEARRRCRIALDVDPDLAIALHCWGTSHLYDRQVPAAALEALRGAAGGVPDGFPADLDLVATLGHQGELEEAWLELHNRLPQLERATLADVARATLVEDAMTHAATHVRRGDVASARSLLEGARIEVGNHELESFLQQLDELEQQQLLDDQILLHNQANAHLNNGNLQQALALIERLLEQELPAEIRESVLRMRDRLAREQP
jgi:tetratricopeptide (TPR) repeat protein